MSFTLLFGFESGSALGSWHIATCSLCEFTLVVKFLGSVGEHLTTDFAFNGFVGLLGGGFLDGI